MSLRLARGNCYAAPMRYIPLVAVLFLFLVQPASASDYPDRFLYGTGGALKHLPGVRVSVSTPDPRSRSIGLTAEKVREAVEGVLRKHKIRVLTNDEWNAARGQPQLGVLATMMGPSWNVNLNLSEDVRLERRNALVRLVTWQIMDMGEAPDPLKDALAGVRKTTERFAKEWAAEDQGKDKHAYKK